MLVWWGNIYSLFNFKELLKIVIGHYLFIYTGINFIFCFINKNSILWKNVLWSTSSDKKSPRHSLLSQVIWVNFEVGLGIRLAGKIYFICKLIRCLHSPYNCHFQKSVPAFSRIAPQTRGDSRQSLAPSTVLPFLPCALLPSLSSF